MYVHILEPGISYDTEGRTKKNAPGKQPGRSMHVRNTSIGRRQRAVLYIRASRQLSCFVSGCVYVFVGRADVDSSFVLRTQRAVETINFQNKKWVKLKF